MQISEYKFRRIVNNPKTKMYVSCYKDLTGHKLGQIIYLLDGYWYIEYPSNMKGQQHFKLVKCPVHNLYELVKREK